MGDPVRSTGVIADTDGTGVSKGVVVTEEVVASGVDGVKAGAEAVNFGDEIVGDLSGS